MEGIRSCVNFMDLSGRYSVSVIGALTNKTYSFGYRKWDLQSSETCDIYEDFYIDIRLESVGLKIVRVLPIEECDVNEEWITNVVRFGLVGLLERRLYAPLVRLGSEYVSVSWFDVMRKIVFMLDVKSMKVCIMRGRIIDSESILWCRELGVLLEGAVDEWSKDGKFEYVNEDLIDYKLIVLLNVDIRKESPLLEFMLKMRGRMKGGFWVDGLSDIENSEMGVGNFVKGRNNICCSVIREELSLIIYGYEYVNEEEMKGVRKLCSEINRELYIYDRIGGRGMIAEMGGFCNLKAKLMYNISEDEVDYGNFKYMIYQGTHTIHSVRYSQSILPVGTFLESEGLFLSSFGDVKASKFIFDIPGMGRKGWKVLMFVKNMICFFEDGIVDLSSTRIKMFKRSCSVIGRGYKFKVVEIVERGWLCILSYVRYEFFISSYYNKCVLGKVSASVGLGAYVDGYDKWDV